MFGILKLAYKLLVNDKAKFTALLIGITFAVFLMTEITAMFAGVLNRASATVINIEAKVWVMDPSVQTVTNTIGMPDYTLDAVRSMNGVKFAVPLFSGALVKLQDGTYQAVNVIGLDDTSLFGRPQMEQGHIENIYAEGAFLVVDDSEFPKLGNPKVAQDAQLNDLEGRVDRGNQTIAAAAANYEAARALVREARSQYFPTLTTNPAITYSRVSTISIPGIASKGYTDTVYDLPFTASWEPDLWGRIRKTVQANINAAQGSAADLENERLLMHANLAADYFNLRGVEQQQRLLDATVIAWNRYLDLTRGLLRSGLGADEAVAAAESQLEAAQAQRTNLGIARSQYEHAIAILIGESPSSFSIVASSNDVHLPAVPVGLPAELLERRPDIAAEERAMAGANAQIGIAKAAYFPNVLLGATGGLESLSFVDWFTWPSRFWSVGPSVAETLFDAGLRRATVRQYQAQYDETVANYRQTVLTAFGQVEDDLAAQRILVQGLQQQEVAVQSAQRYVKQATTRNLSGLDPYLNVLTAQVNLLTYQQTYVTFQTQQLLASVQLIEALGGGWDTTQMPGSKEVSATTAAHHP